MPAYLISLCRKVMDRKRLEDYWANVAPAFKSVMAKPLVACTPFEVLEGDHGVRGVVLFEFASMEEARRWYTSAAYQEVKKLREGAAESISFSWTAEVFRLPQVECRNRQVELTQRKTSRLLPGGIGGRER
jgi:uncharacterized protein (DUF1330 family)